MFQSYQSKQINPDMGELIKAIAEFISFQSYQSKQINPDQSGVGMNYHVIIVSIVSIQTD